MLKQSEKMATRNITCKGVAYDIGYEIVNPKNEKIALFLHGWGANRVLMKKAFASHFGEYKLIFIDLPGFGTSSIEKPMDSFEYLDIVKEFIKSLHVKPYFVIGHSFGGKIATLLNPQNLVLLSSAGIVKEKSLHVKSKIKIFKFLKFIGLGRFYKFFATKDVEGMSEIMYETLKKVVNEKMDEKFSAYTGNALIFWGKEDEATPLKSGEIIHSLIKSSKFFPLEGDHFFFLNQGGEIAKKIKENLC